MTWKDRFGSDCDERGCQTDGALRTSGWSMKSSLNEKAASFNMQPIKTLFLKEEIKKTPKNERIAMRIFQACQMIAIERNVKIFDF